VSDPALPAHFPLFTRPNGPFFIRFAVGFAVSLAVLIGSVEQGGNAIANGDSRTISIFHTHTGESLTIEYKKNGSFDRDALEKLNWLLRDWRRDEPTSMDPRLFDIVWEAQRQVGSSEPINVVSAYRSPETNAMLRRRSKAVAKNSQHMLGKAMDFYLTDANITQIREVGLKMQRGGVGYYPTAFTPFVHLDAGSVRHWPRMSHDELAHLFPDGKTVHLPSDGKPLERYAEAEAEILANGGTVMGASYADAGEGGTAEPTKTKSLWAMLFGSRNEDEDSEVLTQKPVARAVAAKAPIKNTDDSENAPTTERVAEAAPQPKLPQFAAMPPLSSFRMAIPAPNAPMPMSRPVVQTPLTVALQSATPQLVWQAGPQPLSAPTVPLPPVRGGTVAATGSFVALATIPLPPVRNTATKAAGRVAILTVPDGMETTASLGGPKRGLALPKIIAEGGRNPQPSLALGYTTSPEPASSNENQSSATVPQLGAIKTERAKPLPESAIEATHIGLSGKTTQFSGTDDLSPPSGKFSTKTAAACAAGKTGQACMPRAAR
jgi:uncharacterized protein YcbK (DUF882 family)